MKLMLSIILSVPLFSSALQAEDPERNAWERCSSIVETNESLRPISTRDLRQMVRLWLDRHVLFASNREFMLDFIERNKIDVGTHLPKIRALTIEFDVNVRHRKKTVTRRFMLRGSTDHYAYHPSMLEPFLQDPIHEIMSHRRSTSSSTYRDFAQYLGGGGIFAEKLEGSNEVKVWDYEDSHFSAEKRTPDNPSAYGYKNLQIINLSEINDHCQHTVENRPPSIL